jgi:Rrf2 family protein
MQHVLQISRKIDYGLRAMIYLAGRPPGERLSFREIARRIDVPEDFLAKILRTLADAGLVASWRGSGGGYGLGRPAESISFLDVIEAIEGPVRINVCLDGGEDGEACSVAPSCTMLSVWREGQERMLDVYRRSTLADLAAPLRHPLPTVD